MPVVARMDVSDMLNFRERTVSEEVEYVILEIADVLNNEISYGSQMRRESHESSPIFIPYLDDVGSGGEYGISSVVIDGTAALLELRATYLSKEHT